MRNGILYMWMDMRQRHYGFFVIASFYSFDPKFFFYHALRKSCFC